MCFPVQNFKTVIRDMHITESKKVFLTVLILEKNNKPETTIKPTQNPGRKREEQFSSICTLIVLTRLAVLFATSLADCTKCLLATGFAVFDEAIRQALHKADVCLATIVAADNTCRDRWHKPSRLSKEHGSSYTLPVQSCSSMPCKLQTPTPLLGHK